jgi:nucleoside-diphosphate-sugar epimerase
MHILVTGGSGFIGRHLTASLYKAGHRVDTLDLTGVDRSSPQPEHLHFHADAATFSPHVSDSWDRIYHLASPVGPIGVLGRRGKIATDIIGGLANMMRIALAQRARLLYVSSSEVYGPRSDDAPLHEAMTSVVPAEATARLEYGVSKLCGEIMAINFARHTGLPLRMVRLFNTIGEGQDPGKGFVVARFLQQALAGESITVYGDGSQLRAFVDVRDVVSALQVVMEDGDDCSVYNVGNPANLVTILELARMVKCSVTGSASVIIYVDPKDLHGSTFAEAWNKIPDISKLRALGWKPKNELSVTLARLAKGSDQA